MSPMLAGVILNTIFITGVILTPTILADAATDLQGLKTVITSAAVSIGTPTNSSGHWLWQSVKSDMGTADLVQNITGTVLQATYNVDTNKNAWVNGTPITTPSPPPSPAIHTITDLYLDYINTIPNLSSNLTAAGRAWHWEMNAPVWTAIDALQQALSQFSTSLLQADVIDTRAILRTIRASSSLEDAQQAWSKILNLPGSANGMSKSSSKKRAVGVASEVRGPKKFSPNVESSVYTHKELWGRGLRGSSEGMARMYDVIAR